MEKYKQISVEEYEEYKAIWFEAFKRVNAVAPGIGSWGLGRESQVTKRKAIKVAKNLLSKGLISEHDYKLAVLDEKVAVAYLRKEAVAYLRKEADAYLRKKEDNLKTFKAVSKKWQKANSILAKYEDANEMHFHKVDRGFVIDAMLEFAQEEVEALVSCFVSTTNTK